MRHLLSPPPPLPSHFSNFAGSGAPYWALEACGLDPKAFQATQAALVHGNWRGEDGKGELDVANWPDMVSPYASLSLFFSSTFSIIKSRKHQIKDFMVFFFSLPSLISCGKRTSSVWQPLLRLPCSSPAGRMLPNASSTAKTFKTGCKMSVVSSLLC